MANLSGIFVLHCYLSCFSSLCFCPFNSNQRGQKQYYEKGIRGQRRKKELERGLKRGWLGDNNCLLTVKEYLLYCQKRERAGLSLDGQLRLETQRECVCVSVRVSQTLDAYQTTLALILFSSHSFMVSQDEVSQTFGRAYTILKTHTHWLSHRYQSVCVCGKQTASGGCCNTNKTERRRRKRRHGHNCYTRPGHAHPSVCMSFVHLTLPSSEDRSLAAEVHVRHHWRRVEMNFSFNPSA